MVHQKTAIATKTPKPIIRDHLFRAEITSLQIRWTKELKKEARLGCMNIHKEHSNSVASQDQNPHLPNNDQQLHHTVTKKETKLQKDAKYKESEGMSNFSVPLYAQIQSSKANL